MTREHYQRDYRQQYKDQAKRVNLTFSLPEYRSIARGAKTSGLPVAAYVKRLALSAHDRRAETPEELAEQLAELERVIRTIANNVNQMARHSNRIALDLSRLSSDPCAHLCSLAFESQGAFVPQR